MIGALRVNKVVHIRNFLTTVTLKECVSSLLRHIIVILHHNLTSKQYNENIDRRTILIMRKHVKKLTNLSKRSIPLIQSISLILWGTVNLTVITCHKFSLGPNINGLVTDGNTKVCCRGFIFALFFIYKYFEALQPIKLIMNTR